MSLTFLQVPHTCLFSQRIYCLFSAIMPLEMLAFTCPCHDSQTVFILSFFIDETEYEYSGSEEEEEEVPEQEGEPRY